MAYLIWLDASVPNKIFVRELPKSWSKQKCEDYAEEISNPDCLFVLFKKEPAIVRSRVVMSLNGKGWRVKGKRK